MENFKEFYEWFEVLNYVRDICEQLRNEGYDVNYNYYTLDANSFGIHVNLYDSNGHFFKQYSSGVFSSCKQMKDCLDYISEKIKSDVYECNIGACMIEYNKTGHVDMETLLGEEHKKRVLEYADLCARKFIFGNITLMENDDVISLSENKDNSSLLIEMDKSGEVVRKHLKINGYNYIIEGDGLVCAFINDEFLSINDEDFINVMHVLNTFQIGTMKDDHIFSFVNGIKMGGNLESIGFNNSLDVSQRKENSKTSKKLIFQNKKQVV